ncbi:phasin family protein [Arvimicrobium flavum]|uniref:phasin family protein n=1 Tax=Arvimicrobium flavum TaxID=3393320 RepID=UPI00237C46EE|nr:TIGR01841 family phasin [Mesorhizobium shangrilense]
MAKKPQPESTEKPQPDSFVDMFARLGQDLKMPKMDVDDFLAHHRKNLEALEKSAKATAAGASAAMHKQREALQETLREVTEMAHNVRASGSAQEAVSKQVEFARRSFEVAVKNASDIGEILRKSGSETVDILRQRIKDAMEEIRGGADKK